MVRRTFLLLFAAAAAFAQTQAQPPAPKLVLSIMVDQFRYDYLTRWDNEYTGGLKRLLDQGAVFTNGNYEAVPTVTAVGHSTVLTGAPPSISGIVGNTWWERTEGTSVQSITDASVNLLGTTGVGASPRRLLVSTIGDELKLSGKGGKVFSTSLKDRSSILPGGHRADGVFWFDGRTGNFISSTYYFPELPKWVADYNAKRPGDVYAGKPWRDGALPTAPGPDLYNRLDSSPYGDELVLAFALKILETEQLGLGPKTDLLAVSFSSVDYVGHSLGPDAPEMHLMVTHVDKMIGSLIDAAIEQAGQGNVAVVFTADHGVAPVPEVNVRNKMPGGRIDARAERAAIQNALAAKFGPAEYIAAIGEAIYLKPDPIPGAKLDRADLENTAANALRDMPHVFRVYTRTQLLSGSLGGDLVDQRVRNGYHAARSGDLVVIHDPYWLAGTGTNHGTPFSYDTHVPIIFWGPQVRPGRYHQRAAVQDIAPTLSAILNIAQPSGSIGRVLGEILR